MSRSTKLLDRFLSQKKKKAEPSKIALEEYFSAEDDHFLPYLRQFQSAKFLASFVEKWKQDQRAWSRQQIVDYLTGDLNLPGHEVVVKRLYKHFLASADHEMLGVFMLVFDRLVRRSRVQTYRYDWETRQSWYEENLKAKPNKTIHDVTGRTMEYAWRGQTTQYPLPDQLNRPNNMLFSHRTRNYLRRSVWRHFRFLSFRDPDTYVQEIARALARYRDSEFATGENVLDNWSLMHACYYSHSAIEFSACHTNLVDGHSLQNLVPKPFQPTAWKSEAGSDALIRLLIDAQSTLVRIWAIELLKSEHETALKNIKLAFLIELLGSPDPNLHEFAASIFEEHPALPTLTVQQWLDLLANGDANLLPVICDAMRKHVAEERLDNDQLVQLTCAQQVPVSTLGFEMLEKRDASQSLTVDELSPLSEIECATLSPTVTPWALNRICDRGNNDADQIIDFFDSLLRPTRNASMQWLSRPDSPSYNDPKLWARLIESPFDDVRLALIELLEKRENRLGVSGAKLTPVWVSVVAGIHRGGRTKPKAINQISNEIAADPQLAEQLIPVLAVALRSVRAPEMRYALSSIVRLANHSPELKSKIQSHFPEIEFLTPETVS